MCDQCGCAVEGVKDPIAVDVLLDLNEQNNVQANHNRAHFDRHGVLCLNIMSSPGSGKTRLLQSLIPLLKDELNLAVIEGDLETENDAERIREAGVPALQINTSTACHLDAQQIHHALHQLALSDIDVLIIENVGNLVCPASFDLGQDKNIVLLATTEGDDKPAKYPVMFKLADTVLFSKSDLLNVLDDFSTHAAEQHIRHLASSAPCMTVSGKTGDGLAEFARLVKYWHTTKFKNQINMAPFAEA